MSRNLCRINCRTCNGKVVLSGIPYQLAPKHGPYCHGLWVADATCKECGTKYTAWIGPSTDSYGWRAIDLQSVAHFGFYDLSYRGTFNDEPGEDDVPKEKVQVFRVVRIGTTDTWTEITED